jgi:hypothetical protein
MTLTLAVALLVQAAGAALLRLRLGKTWLRRPVTLLFLASVIDQAVSPVLLAIPQVGQWDTFRQGVPRAFTDEADLILSAAMLALVVGYLLTRPERAVMQVTGDSLMRARRALDWRWLAAASAPLAVLTYAGRGYNDGTVAGARTGVGTDLAVAFFLLLVVLAAFGFILRHGSRWLLPVLAVQSLVLAAAGERTPVLADAVTLLVLLAVSGIRVRPAQITAIAVLTVVAGVAITGSRVTNGRQVYYEDSGAEQRVAALQHGISALGGATGGGPGLVAQFATRMDAPDFAGAILQGMALGQPRLGAGHVPESLLEAVPSFLWPSKLSFLSVGSPQQVEIDSFGLQQVNWIPGLPGMYIGFLPAGWLLAFMALLGLLAGWGERWLFARCTPSRLVWLSAAVLACVFYEAGLPAMLLTLRAGLVVVAATLLLEAARGRVGARRVARPQCGTPGRPEGDTLRGPAISGLRRDRERGLLEGGRGAVQVEAADPLAHPVP